MTKHSKAKLDKSAKTKRIISVAIIVLVVLACAAATTSYFYLKSKLKKIEPIIEVNEYGETISYTETELSCVDVDGYINILLVGVDSRDMSKMDGWRADAIIIASIKEETGEVFLTSIYRDTMLLIGDDGFYDKVTHSFYYGGMAGTIKTLNQALDLNIKNYVVFNFKAAADIIDAMGGLDVEIEEYEIDELNYINKKTCKTIGQKNIMVVKEPGLQHLDGAMSVTYGRIRHGVGDDFKRTERMRTILTKVMDKVKTMGLIEIDGLIDLGLSQVKTNLSDADILGLAMRMARFKLAGSDGFPYTVVTGTLDGVSYVFPYRLYDDVVSLHELAFGQEGYVPGEKVRAISQDVLNYYAIAENQRKVDVNQYYENPTAQPQILDWTENENSTEAKPVDETEQNSSEDDNAEIPSGDIEAGENTQDVNSGDSEGENEGNSNGGTENGTDGESDDANENDNDNNNDNGLEGVSGDDNGESADEGSTDEGDTGEENQGGISENQENQNQNTDGVENESSGDESSNQEGSQDGGSGIEEGPTEGEAE